MLTRARLSRNQAARSPDSCRAPATQNASTALARFHIYDPTLNPLYRDVLEHYGAVALDVDRRQHVGLYLA